MAPPHRRSAIGARRSRLRDVALRLKPLIDGIPLDITVVATHAVAGHIAVEAGFKKVRTAALRPRCPPSAASFTAATASGSLALTPLPRMLGR